MNNVKIQDIFVEEAKGKSEKSKAKKYLIGVKS